MENEEKELVVSVSKTIVEALAPAELDLFDHLAKEYFENPQTVYELAPEKQEVGFGLEDCRALTPAALAMVSAVVPFICNEILGAAKSETVEWIRKKVKLLFNKRTGSGAGLSLTREQLLKIERYAQAEAVKFGMPKEASKNLARALIGTLAIR